MCGFLMPRYAFKCLDDKSTICPVLWEKLKLKLRLYKPITYVFSKYLKGFDIALWVFDIIIEHVISNYELLFCGKSTSMT